MTDARVACRLGAGDVRLTVPLQEVDRLCSAAGDLQQTVGQLFLGQPWRAVALRRLGFDSDRLPGWLWLAGRRLHQYHHRAISGDAVPLGGVRVLIRIDDLVAQVGRLLGIAAEEGGRLGPAVRGE